MFKSRVYNPDPDEDMTADQRLKKFNHLINIKIQNTRASQKTKTKTVKPPSEKRAQDSDG
jgi:hypothetical protein